jgi:beta-glucanase (GH16 family)
MKFKTICAAVVIACLLYILASAQRPHQSHQFADIPVWADEFTTPGMPDTLKWSYDVGGHGWGNNELQYYTNNGNAVVKDGCLQIWAKCESFAGSRYTSARLVSKGMGDFLYGRFEARAKLPTGLGTWPAIWLLPTNWHYGDWPASGEIDIMEHVGFSQDTIHISAHTKAFNHIMGTQKTAFRYVPQVSERFHTYRVDWTPDYIEGFVDDELLFSMNRENKTFAEWPFDQPFHWLLNVAVGGNWGGLKGIDPQAFPAILYIDYVRVFPLRKH